MTSRMRARSSSTRGRDDEHLGAELGERVGDREPGDAEPEHGDAEAPPVGVPAGQRVEPARRRGASDRSALQPLEVERADARGDEAGRAMIQKRTTIVTSAQPFSSKWWWIGLIRKMRLPPRELEVRALHDDRAGLDDEEAADEEQRAARCG